MRRLAMLAVLVAGCAVESPVLQVGTGLQRFQPLEDGDPIELHAGPQGGYHVFLGLRCAGCPAPMTLRYGVLDAHSGEPLTFTGERVMSLREEDGWAEYAPLIGFLQSTAAEDYLQREITLWAVLLEDEHITAEAQTAAVIIAP